MHTHVLAHLHMVHTLTRTEKGNERVLLFRQTPVYEVHDHHKIPMFTFQVQTRTQTDQPKQMQQHSPTATGSSRPTLRQGYSRERELRQGSGGLEDLSAHTWCRLSPRT